MSAIKIDKLFLTNTTNYNGGRISTALVQRSKGSTHAICY